MVCSREVGEQVRPKLEQLNKNSDFGLADVFVNRPLVSCFCIRLVDSLILVFILFFALEP
jgi:hypothetical protein